MFPIAKKISMTVYNIFKQGKQGALASLYEDMLTNQWL